MNWLARPPAAAGRRRGARRSDAELHRAMALILALIAIPVDSVTAAGDGDGWRFQIVYRYHLDSSAAPGNSSGLAFDLTHARHPEVSFPPTMSPISKLSCTGCIDAEYRRLAVIYGLLLVVGYKLVEDARDD